MSVYIVPVMLLASAAKQKTSCMAQISCCGNMWSTSERAAIISFCLFRVEAVLDLCRRMCPLSVAVDRGK